MEANNDENELVGPTAIAYHLQNRIHLVVDSRMSNDTKSSRTSRTKNWKLKIRNGTQKFRILSQRVVMLLVGEVNPSKIMVGKLAKWIEEKYTNPLVETEVADVVNYVEHYFNNLDNSREYGFGTIIAGYDSVKELHQVSIKKVIESTKIETFTCIGTGSKHINTYIRERYRSQDLAYPSILMSSFKDKNTDGNVKFLEVTKTHCEEIGGIECLPLYEKYYEKFYEMPDGNCILFSIYEDSNGPIPTDVFESYFCEHGVMEASHCVDHRVSKGGEKGFYFHRLVFSSPKEVEVALTHLNETKIDTDIFSKFPYFCSKLHDDEIELYMSKASKDVLNHVINNSWAK